MTDQVFVIYGIGGTILGWAIATLILEPKAFPEFFVGVWKEIVSWIPRKKSSQK